MIKALPNLSSTDVFDVEPWSYYEQTKPALRNQDSPGDESKRSSEIFRKFSGNKKEFLAWCKLPTTQHCFYSLHEGEIASQRIDKSNAAYRCHGIVLDFDCAWEPGESGFQKLMARLNAELTLDLHPNFVCRTFSGGWRLIWIFEEDLYVIDRKIHSRFLERASKEFLKAARILPNLDDNSFHEGHYWELGSDWKVVNERQISPNTVWGWYALIVKDIKRIGKVEDTLVPIDVVRRWVHDDFPGKWMGEFEINARGPRFWDPEAKDESAAIVKENGMIFFTDGGGFRSWRQIFGDAKLKAFEADKVGRAIRSVWWDGTKYYVIRNDRTTKHFFTEYSKQNDVKTFLEVNYAISTERYGGPSEMQQALETVHSLKEITVAAPFVYRPRGVIHFNGEKVFNTSTTEPISPADSGEVNKWPWINRFLTSFFSDEEQLEYFLAWLKRFYEGALEKKPKMGQIVYIVGPVQKGKTFLSNILVSKLMGGHATCSEYITGNTPFNGSLLRYGLWTIDDQQALVDHKAMNFYNGMIKRLAATPVIQLNQKFQRVHDVDWRGRIIVTCNPDAESMRILPDMDINLDDKIMIFQCAEAEEGLFMSGKHEKIDDELPYFARWLLSCWEPKDKDIFVADGRYGITAFKHPLLAERAKQNSDSHQFLEILYIFMSERNEPWTGTATELLRELTMDGSSLTKLMSKYTINMVGRRLHQLMSRGIPINQKLVKENGEVFRKYTIPVRLANISK